jgi:hypothetical protein
MTDTTDPQPLCRTCMTQIGYIGAPTGGWWAHETHPTDEHDAVPGGWVDGDELMEAIAAAVWEHCSIEGTASLVVDDPRNIAGTAAAVARRLLAAPVAVPSAPADRAAIYREVADRLAADAEQGAKEGFTRIYRRSAARQVREWAGEAQQPETGAFVCKCPAELCHCGHHATVSQPAVGAQQPKEA